MAQQNKMNALQIEALRGGEGGINKALIKVEAHLVHELVDSRWLRIPE